MEKSFIFIFFTIDIYNINVSVIRGINNMSAEVNRGRRINNERKHKTVLNTMSSALQFALTLRNDCLFNNYVNDVAVYDGSSTSSRNVSAGRPRPGLSAAWVCPLRNGCAKWNDTGDETRRAYCFHISYLGSHPTSVRERPPYIEIYINFCK